MLAVPPIRLTPWTTVLLSRLTCTRTIFLAASCSSRSPINTGLRPKRRIRVGLLTSASENTPSGARRPRAEQSWHERKGGEQSPPFLLGTPSRLEKSLRLAGEGQAFRLSLIIWHNMSDRKNLYRS